MSFVQFSFPTQIMRGAGCIEQLYPQLKSEASRVFILGGKRALASLQPIIDGWQAQDEGPEFEVSWFGGEVTMNHVTRLREELQRFGADHVIAVGGGKATDTGKLVAEYSALPLTVIPTIAATCAAVSTVSVLYGDDGEYLDLIQNHHAPERVVLDPAIIAQSPVRWLAAGLGDTLAKLYEFRVISGEHPDTSLQMAAYANGKLCYDVIEKFGAQAVSEVRHQTGGPALEQVMDAIFIYAGFTSILGHGDHAAAAHALFEGFTVSNKTKDFGHGLLVGFGNLVLLWLEGRSEKELAEAILLARACEVPVTLADIAELTQEELAPIADAAIATSDMDNMPEPVTREALIQAMYSVSDLAKRLVA